MSPDTRARLAQMRRDRRVAWTAFGLRCVGGAALVLALVEWVKRT